jgi:heme exporter protein B
MNEIKALIIKEFKVEFRQKYALFGILLYVAGTCFVAYLSFKQIVQVNTWNALLWIIILFACIQAAAKSFMLETAGRNLYYYTLISPEKFIIAKLIYNSMLLVFTGIMTFLIYQTLLGNLIQDNFMFFLGLIFGTAGLSGVLTLMSAIASKTEQNTTLMSILSLPVLLPLLLTTVKFSKNAIDGIDRGINLSYLGVILLLNVIVWVLGFVLFPYLWRE